MVNIQRRNSGPDGVQMGQMKGGPVLRVGLTLEGGVSSSVGVVAEGHPFAGEGAGAGLTNFAH